MGSLENGQPLKREHHLLPRSASSATKIERLSLLQRLRSRFSRFLLFQKLDYIQWICTIAVFFAFMVLGQMFLPGLVMEKSRSSSSSPDSILGLGSREAFRFDRQLGLVGKFPWLELNGSSSALARLQHRFGYRKPQLALVFADLVADPQQLLMVTVATALREIGYEIQVFSLEDGSMHEAWRQIGVAVTIIQANEKMKVYVDWLNYDGVLVNSLEARDIVSSLMQEPFKSVPLIWTIHERTLAIRSKLYALNEQIELLNDWKKVFKRATVVVFPNYVLPMIYSTFDAGNYFVIPGSPAESWGAEAATALNEGNLRVKMGYRLEDVVIAIVGSPYLYRDLWLDHALILQALLPVFTENPDINSDSHLKIIVLSGDTSGNYSVAVEAMALSLRYPTDTVNHIVLDENIDGILSMADLVIYGSFLEEQSFPDILKKAMSSGKPIISPDLPMIRKYVNHRVNGYLFPKENTKILTQIVMEIIQKGNLSSLAHTVALTGRITAKNLMVSETVEGYASLLEYVVNLPSEVAYPKPVTEIPPNLKGEWQWHIFKDFLNVTHPDKIQKSFSFLTKVEEQWNHTHTGSLDYVASTDDSFSYSLWEEHKNIELASIKKRREEDELKDRNGQTRLTWEEVYRNAKRADRSRNDLHERDEGELQRTGQPLCIYEPYFGEGTWPFLHLTSLYRGIGLSTKGRRPGTDDIDAPSRLSLLNNPYYRDTLGEHGAFFSIANRIDRVHKNSWIGFQSWRATARKASLSRNAENALLEAIQARKHGDTLYFWVRQDMEHRNQSQPDFWSFCDAINAGSCRSAVSNALQRMYGIKQDLDPLPPMPIDGDTWSVMNCWALPTRSFLEFVMFSRMFVDALDAEMYDEHRHSGYCRLSLSKDKHCYSRVLELLVNVWAFHSARRMVYVNPETGEMQEQHKLKSRRGQMWIKWFSYTTLKSMDEDLAEESDTDPVPKRWLWPSTGEVFWQGVSDREKSQRHKQKEKKKQESKAKIKRMRSKQKQRVLGRYVKPPPDPEQTKNSNATVTTAESDERRLL